MAINQLIEIIEYCMERLNDIINNPTEMYANLTIKKMYIFDTNLAYL